ncbi:hypothetical protein ACFLXZ_01815 [Chloroflexota bacterium]
MVIIDPLNLITPASRIKPISLESEGRGMPLTQLLRLLFYRNWYPRHYLVHYGFRSLPPQAGRSPWALVRTQPLPLVIPHSGLD